MKSFEVLQELLKEEHSFHLMFFLLWQFNCVKHSCLNLSLPGFANKDTPNSVCAEYPFCMTLGTGNFANVWAFCPIVLSPLYQCHQCFGPISASRLLSLPSRKRLDSDSNEVDEDPKAFISILQNDSMFCSCSFHTMVLIVSDSSVSSACLLSLQLNWRPAPKELGLCQVV